MPLNITVQDIAQKYATQRADAENVPARQRENAINKFGYDFKVTAFNVATAALVATVALGAILSCKALFLVVGLIIWGVRAAVQLNLNETNQADIGNEQAFFARLRQQLGIADPNDPAYRGRLMEHFGLRNAEWQPDAASIFNFVFWKNHAPTAEAPPAPAGRAAPAAVQVAQRHGPRAEMAEQRGDAEMGVHRGDAEGPRHRRAAGREEDPLAMGLGAARHLPDEAAREVPEDDAAMAVRLAREDRAAGAYAADDHGFGAPFPAGGPGIAFLAPGPGARVGVGLGGVQRMEFRLPGAGAGELAARAPDEE